MTNFMQLFVWATPRNPLLKTRALWPYAAALCLAALICVFPAERGWCQQALAKPQSVKPQNAPLTNPAPEVADDEDQPVPGDWGPALLYSILSSSNEEAQFGLLRATFAAGPAIIPQLGEALKDDRTAEYAAQSLAYIGGEKALPLLWKLLSDPRDLNLRRFTYGALAEFDSPQATDVLFEAINKSDNEPDRTVTESAVIALTVRTDAALIPRLMAAEKKLQDVVIRDDVDNARSVISERAKYMASPQGKRAGGSIESAVRTYFIPALEPQSASAAPASSPARNVDGKALPAHSLAKPQPLITVEVRSVTLSPDKNRALARVVFADPSAMAFYDFVLEKRYGDWTLASVWLGPEVDKPGIGTRGSELGARESGPETPQ